MAFKDIVVHVDESKHCPTRIDVALRLANDHGAHVSGVYVKQPVNLPAYVAAQVGPEVIEVHNKLAAEAAAKAEASFTSMAEKAGVTAEWRVWEGAIDEVVALHARYADLTVIGQADPEGETASDAIDVPGHVVLFSGRPVLVVPYAGTFAKIGENVLVAWNASRESARAVNDAMPFLERAKSVTVLSVNPNRSGGGDLGDLPGADISLHLARHGVKTEAAQIFAEDVDVGDMILSRISDVGADLVVMGGYGRSRLRELVMGGASRHLLHHMTVPVVMAH
jgi:nucleotide-binding universal stress UspA family protein